MKAVLVIDMPKTCKGCQLYLKGEPNEWCYALKHGLDDSTKPTWCPLRPLPQMKEEAVPYQVSEDEIDAYQDPYATGFNDAIRLITGETE